MNESLYEFGEFYEGERFITNSRNLGLNNGRNFIIEACPSHKYNQEPYFKVLLYNTSYQGFDCTRISMIHPKFIGPVDFKPTKEEIESMIRYFNSNNEYGINGWKYLIDQTNEEAKDVLCDESYLWEDINNNLPVPDYYKLLEE